MRRDSGARRPAWSIVSGVRTPIFAASFCMALLGAPPASAQGAGDGADRAGAPDTGEDEPDYGHFGQLGLRVGLVGGYRMVFRYDNSPFCTEPDPAKGEDQQKFCGHAAPFAADLGISFALLDFFEPFAWARFGLSGEDETDTDPQVLLGVGARLYMTADSPFKVFIQPAIGWSFEGAQASPEYQLPGFDINYKQDLVFHVAAGPHFDFNENFGAFFAGGMTVGVVRAISASLELQAGVQGRVF